MIKFSYLLNQDNIELQASNWCGLERVFINGKVVSRKFNFGLQSMHDVLLDNGKKCRFQLITDPQTSLISCRIYKQNQLVTILKQGKKQLQKSQFMIESGFVIVCVGMLSMYLLS
ncbi:hypothetical protein [Shewanella saliphila]|uniref:Uncharacterized protein n=1 Tax=Shewanella saliphila TaxID=2282698 RepID=A0ABQ2Q0N9_9GAMM|nr:hypothetical protein [Shewanella saliphila]MCL1100196.1 hypothetical protein [Shewanella saliphila]GGP38749.1 hypothetical protein GCM10009409_02160 [Shewanella saliphila]